MSTSMACLSGEWTIHVIAQHREAMLLLVNDGQYEFDASGITDMDSAGLQLLLAAQRSIAKQGRELRLVACSGAVKDVLATYGLDTTLMPVNLEEAVS